MIYCRACKADLARQDIEASHLRGLWAEQFVLEALNASKHKHPWVKSIRKATYYEDTQGYDIVVTTQTHPNRDEIEIPVQVKASTGKAKRKGNIVVVRTTTHTKKNKQPEEIAKQAYEQIEKLIPLRALEISLARQAKSKMFGFLVEGQLCMI